MLKLRNQRIGIGLTLAMTSFVLMQFSGLVKAADESEVAVGKPVFNSLETFQINCGADGAASNATVAEDIAKHATSVKPGERVGALSQLATKGAVDGASAQKILQAALRDQDANVRAQAVHAVVQQGCADTVLFLGQALNDSELPVRLMAVDNLHADEDGSQLLERALDDEAEAIRELAAAKLGATTMSASH
mgnify:CR=1 FL=1